MISIADSFSRQYASETVFKPAAALPRPREVHIAPPDRTVRAGKPRAEARAAAFSPADKATIASMTATRLVARHREKTAGGPPELVEKLRELWAQDLPASVIAPQIGKTESNLYMFASKHRDICPVRGARGRRAAS